MHRPNPLPTGANAIRDTALDIFRHLLRFCLDSLLIVAAFGAALLLRFDGFAPAPYPLYFVLAMPVVILIYTLALLAFGTHENLWQFAGVAELSRLWGACLTATGVLILADLASIFVTEYDIYALPVSVVVSGGVFSGVLLTGSRLWRRVLALFRQPAAPAEAAQRVLIVGAGSAGALLGRELLLHRRHAYVPVGFVDDDRAKLGKVIHGIRVLGTRDDIPALVAEHDIDVVAIAIPSRPSIVREIFRICRNTSAKVRNVPGLAEIVEGRAPVDALREITIEDLLRRDEVTLDHAAVKDYFAGRTILVTGAAGSIGSELCRQLIAFEPKQLVLLDFNESDLFTLEQELLAQTEPERVLGLIADVTNAERLGAAIRRFAPEVIFHAAAYKHVDMMEKHPEEALRVNVLGTDNLCRAADGIARQVVLISSDKAVHPKSVMGCSKRLAEQIIADWAGRSTTRYCAVRFGNVLGSRGSVIPQFKAQIERGGPLEVRNPNATRYFMTIREACQLVIQAAALGEGGSLFVLDMGEPVRIGDLAEDMIRLSGLRVGEDIEIREVGLRPGEKLHEELFNRDELATRSLTSHAKIFTASIVPMDRAALHEFLAELRAGLGLLSVEQVRRRLGDLIDEYRTEVDREQTEPILQ